MESGAVWDSTVTGGERGGSRLSNSPVTVKADKYSVLMKQKNTPFKERVILLRCHHRVVLLHMKVHY